VRAKASRLPLLIRHEYPPFPILVGFKNVAEGGPIFEITAMTVPQQVICVGANSPAFSQRRQAVFFESGRSFLANF